MKKFLSKLLILFLLTNLSKEGTKKDCSGLYEEYDGKLYSGYLDAFKEGDKFFYIYAPAQKDPEKAPLVLWLQGGPGASSLWGFTYLLGPVVTYKYAGKWFRNPYAWNMIANILVIDQPAGVGFSITNQPKFNWNDKRMAKNLLVGLKDFFAIYPEFKQRDFYISGDSYTGAYAPAMSIEILEDTSENKITNLKGVLIGNGLTDFETDVERSFVHFMYYHGFTSTELFKEFNENCYHLDDETDPQNKRINLKELRPRKVTKKCNQIRNKIGLSLNGIDQKSILRECLQGSSANNELNRGMSYEDSILKGLLNFSKKKNINEEEMEYEVPVWGRSGCGGDNIMEEKFNEKRVKELLGVAHPEETYKGSASLNYDIGENFYFYNEFMKKHPNLRVWHYSGTEDSILGPLCQMRWIHKLNLGIETEWRAWKTDGITLGFVQRYSSGLVFITVQGSGHSLSFKENEASFIMLNSFLKGELPPEK